MPNYSKVMSGSKAKSPKKISSKPKPNSKKTGTKKNY